MFGRISTILWQNNFRNIEEGRNLATEPRNALLSWNFSMRKVIASLNVKQKSRNMPFSTRST
jgi:hypothetical protein